MMASLWMWTGKSCDKIYNKTNQTTKQQQPPVNIVIYIFYYYYYYYYVIYVLVVLCLFYKQFATMMQTALCLLANARPSSVRLCVGRRHRLSASHLAQFVK